MRTATGNAGPREVADEAGIVERPSRRKRWTIVAIGLLVAAYVLSPWATLGRLAYAMRSGDGTRAASYLNAPSIRTSIARQMIAAYADFFLGDRNLSEAERSAARGMGRRAIEAHIADILPDAAFADLLTGRLTQVTVRGRVVDVSGFALSGATFSDPLRLWLRSGFSSPIDYEIVAGDDDRAPTLGLRITTRGWMIERLALPRPLLDQLFAAWRERAGR